MEAESETEKEIQENKGKILKVIEIKIDPLTGKEIFIN